MPEENIAPPLVDPIDLMKRLSIDATGRWNVPLREVSLRPYPYPYFAAFALANENSYASKRQFEDVHGFINGRRTTEFGDGLGLEVGDSFAMGDDGSPRLTLGGEDPAEVGRMEQLCRTGWLDSIYCPDPAPRAAFSRRLEQWPAQRRPSVVLGSVSAVERAALEASGVRYFGDDGRIEIDKFGDYHDHKIIERFQLAAREYDWRRWFEWAHGADPTADAKSLAACMNQTLCDPEQADAGSFSFKRYSGPWLASMPTFSAQVTSVLLDRLINHTGAVIVQQQLGRWSLIGAPPERSRARPNTGPALDRHAIAAWREIAERQAAGRLWVVTTSRLLDHLWRRQSLGFTVEKSNERWIVRMHGLHCPIFGDRSLEDRDLNGLSFTVPEAAPEVIVVLGPDRAPLQMQRAVDPCYRLRHAVYRPWTSLEWPELEAGQPSYE
jgi:hypothetical protein